MRYFLKCIFYLLVVAWDHFSVIIIPPSLHSYKALMDCVTSLMQLNTVLRCLLELC